MALHLVDVGMRFGRQYALRHVTLDFQSATVHGLVGHNGSGKSTLIRMLAGYHRPAEGTIRLGDTEIPPGSTHAAHQRGLRFVHQDLGLVPEFNALENFGLGAGYQQTKRKTIDWTGQRKRLRAAQELLHISLPEDRSARMLQPVERTFLAIARAVAPAVDGTPARFLILDEPTTSLERPEAELLFALVRRLSDQGVGVLYVSHQLDDVLRICNDVSVLRDGRLVRTMHCDRARREELVDCMIGAVEMETSGFGGPISPSLVGDIESSAGAPVAPRKTESDAAPALEIAGMNTPRLKDITFEVHRGECVCVVGLSGSGREEFVYAASGAMETKIRRVAIGGEVLTRLSPIEFRRLGVALVPGNRLPGSIVGDFTIQENISFSALSRMTAAGLIRPMRERALAKRWIQRLDIRPDDPSYSCRNLSGGNKQKVILAKWLAIEPSLMFIDEPTAGVDVGAAATLLGVLRSLADEGRALLISTSEVSDVLTIADRVLVLNQGRLVSDLRRGEHEWSEAFFVEAMSRSR